MNFKDMVAADNLNVFLNIDEFAEYHMIRYDGVLYRNVPCVITQLKEQDRRTTVRDHAQGLYLVTAIFHCRLCDIGGVVPEKGGRFEISDGDFMQRHYVAQSSCAMGMVRLELEAYDE